MSAKSRRMDLTRLVSQFSMRPYALSAEARAGPSAHQSSTAFMMVLSVSACPVGCAVGREGLLVGALVVGVVGLVVGTVVGAALVGAVVGAALGRLLAVGRLGRCVLLGGAKRAICPLFLVAAAPSAWLMMALMMVTLIAGVFPDAGAEMGPSTLLMTMTATAPRSCAWATLRSILQEPRVTSRTLPM